MKKFFVLLPLMASLFLAGSISGQEPGENIPVEEVVSEVEKPGDAVFPPTVPPLEGEATGQKEGEDSPSIESQPIEVIPESEESPMTENTETQAEDARSTSPISGLELKAEPKLEQEPQPQGPRRVNFPVVPNVLLEDPLPHNPPPSPPVQKGDLTGPVYIGHRVVIEKYAGWGWIRKESDSWRKGRWVALQEELGEIEAPGRYTRHPESDQDVQYRLFGEFTDDTVYEPNIDVFIPVFALKGFELIGPAPRPDLRPPRGSGNAPTRSRPTTGGARTNPFNR